MTFSFGRLGSPKRLSSGPQTCKTNTFPTQLSPPPINLGILYSMVCDVLKSFCLATPFLRQFYYLLTQKKGPLWYPDTVLSESCAMIEYSLTFFFMSAKISPSRSSESRLTFRKPPFQQGWVRPADCLQGPTGCGTAKRTLLRTRQATALCLSKPQSHHLRGARSQSQMKGSFTTATLGI